MQLSFSCIKGDVDVTRMLLCMTSQLMIIMAGMLTASSIAIDKFSKQYTFVQTMSWWHRTQQHAELSHNL